MNKNRLGCLSPTANFATLFTLLFIIGYAFFNGNELFTAGALSARTGDIFGGVSSHAEIGSDCAQCHTAPWDADTMDDRCKVCHTDITDQLADPASLHGKLMNDRPFICRDCHTEHRGPNMSLTDMRVGKFPHDATGYSLNSHRQRTDGLDFVCADCHATDITSFDPVTCITCHQQVDNVFLESHSLDYGTDCVGCHDGLETINKDFNHSRALFKLEGKHKGLICEKCHFNEKTAADFKSQYTECGLCHLKDDIHLGKFGKDCAACHQPTGWKPAAFDHNLADFKLTGAHTGLVCEKCHIDNVYKGTASDCFACHQQDDHHNGSMGQNCAACHQTSGWKPATFDHNLAAFKLSGAHAIVVCENCHVNQVFKGTPSNCFACHQKDDHHNGSFRQACDACHSSEAWKPATFDHSLAAFKLSGAHGTVLCEQCHVNNIFKGTPSNCFACHQKDDHHNGSFGQNCGVCHSSEAWKPAAFDHNLAAFKLSGSHTTVLCEKCHINNVFKGTPSNCFACHQKNDQHNGSLGQNCGVCHSTSAWKPAAFDHNLATFKLVGAHLSVICEKCHVNNVFKGTPSDCFACHQKDDRHNGSLGQNCATCHSSQAWKPATFDHNISFFKLTGAHISAACARCHVNNVFKGTPSTCYACHQNVDHHNGQFGQNCGVCHATTAWKPAAFDHNLSTFKLTGAHVSATCARCHVNNIYKGTPSNCFACHQSDDRHNGSLGQNCATCHSTSAWKPATFDHNLSFFKLTGAHISATCARCHVNNTFKGTPSNCFACHQSDDRHNGSLGQNCVSCHSTSAWKPASFDHNISTFKLTGAHASATCARCHVNNVFKGTPSNCTACHKDNHNGAFGQNCATCHSTSAWKPASFDHNISAFKLTGAHTSATCAKCHVNNVFKGTPSNCTACHRDNHAGAFGQNCATCHSTSAWKPASFDHNISVFKLTGAHASAACTRCHVNNIFKGTPSSCVSCHQDNHNGAFGQNCVSCHSTSAWRPASFDHNISVFKLTGAHASAACARCHVNNVFKGTPSSCVSCHQDNHNGAFGQICSSCHSTQTWAGATFDHNLSAFKLTGRHASVACQSCHINNVFKGTSQVCSSCHADPAFHAGVFAGQACSNCHNTSSWAPAIFNLSHPEPKGGGDAGRGVNHGGGGCRSCHTVNLMTATCTKCHKSNNPGD
ncbi:MAG: hypothetical protein NTW32_02585 [Chloroflexi bacterium]|nr:hypothetical protein [Chloroflexota bacterium]